MSEAERHQWITQILRDLADLRAEQARERAEGVSTDVPSKAPASEDVAA